MRIAFFGSSLVSAYWNGAATYYRGIIRSLAELGHQVTFFEPDAYDRQKNRDIDPPDWAEVVVYQPTEEDASRMLQRARLDDVIVKASGVGVLDSFLEKEVAALRRESTAVIFWDVDAPATLDRVNGDAGDAFRPLIPRYDFVFTYGGGDPVVSAYRRLGARECVPIYNALDAETHYPVPPDPRFEASLSFLGNRLPDREERVEEFFLNAAELLPDERFLLGGSGWESKAIPPNVRHFGHVFTSDHNAFNCTPKAVLNISRESMARYGFSPATRVFEAAGAASCLLTDAWEGLELFLEPEREVIVVHDGSEVAERLRSLTESDAKRIGEAARKRVLAEHTYRHRAQLVDRLLRGTGSSETRAAFEEDPRVSAEVVG